MTQAHDQSGRALPWPYLLNTPILTAYGDFRFTGPITPEQARERLAGGFVSAIGHASSATFLAALIGLDIPVNRISVNMQPGDSALVLRLRARLPEGKILTSDEMAQVQYELGWLTRLA